MAEQEIIIIGAGGGSRELISLIRDSRACGVDAHAWKIRGILDDNEALARAELAGVPVVGTLAQHDSFRGCRFLSGIANYRNPGIRLEVASRIQLPTERWATFVHPRALVMDGAEIGPGTIVYPGAVISSDAKLGAQVVAYYGAVVHHETTVGDGTCLCAGALLAGRVKVGRGCYLGIGSVVRDDVVISQGAVIGAGAVVVGDVPRDATIVGVPGRSISTVQE